MITIMVVMMVVMIVPWVTVIDSSQYSYLDHDTATTLDKLTIRANVKAGEVRKAS